MQHHRSETDLSVRWTKPEAGWLKCNVDAAIFNQEGYIGFGCVIRNEEGVKVAAKNGILYGVLDPAMAEAMSCREVLSWLKSLNII